MSDALEVRLQSAVGSRYRLQRELGAGGMARVWLAEDLRHSAPVAIKVLRPGLAELLGPEHFLREVEIIARLTHPHILSLRDSGEADGLLYYVMPYVAGGSLRDRLVGEGPLPVDEALRLGLEIVDALGYAHRRGVIHRDLKPENILLEGGHAWVADFGNARAFDLVGSTRLNETGYVLGTPAYMSPEQAAGIREVDPRSDIYSFACVLYEMLAGRPPFTGTTRASLLEQHRTATPRPLTDLRPDAGAGLNAVLDRALAKTPAERLASAAELVAALESCRADPNARSPERGRRVPVRHVPTRRRKILIASIAVLALAALALSQRNALLGLLRPSDSAKPATKSWLLVADFEGPRDDPDLAGAVRSLVIAGLDQSDHVAPVPPEQVREALRHAARPDTARLTPELAREIAYRSAVRAILAGELHRLGGGYSLIVRVMDVERDSLVLALDQQATGEKDLIPAVERLTRRLRSALGERRDAIRAMRPMFLVLTPSFDAYRKLVEGSQVIFRGRYPECYRDANRLYREALALDPDFAQAYLAMAGAFVSLGEPDSATWAFEQAARRPERLGEIARLRLQASLAKDDAAALTIYDAILGRDSTRTGVWNARMRVMSATGRLEEAVRSEEQSVRWRAFGPTPVHLHNLFFLSMRLGEYEPAVAALERLPSTSITTEYGRIWLAHARGRSSEAESLATALLVNHTTSSYARWQALRTLAGELAARGQVSEAASALARARATRMSVEGAEPGRLEERAQILLTYASGENVLPPAPALGRDTTAGIISKGLSSAVLGDTLVARRWLAALEARSQTERDKHGAGPAVLEGFVALRTQRWEEAVRVLQPAVWESDEWGEVRDRVGRQWPCWIVAEAWEKLGRADSAAVYYERATSRGKTVWFGEARAISSFAHHRLALLHARAGHPADAERHWRIFAGSFTRPDPGVRSLLDETRDVISAMRAMTGGGTR